MDRMFDSALNSLKKPQNDKRMLQILVTIRKNIDSSRTHEKIRRLQKGGYLKTVVDYLDNETTSIELKGICLSIIGNTCLDPGTAKDFIRKLQVLPVLVKLYGDHNVDSMKGRIFRIIGNLCDGWNATTVLEDCPQIITPLKSFFNDLLKENDESATKSSEATITMGLRASRKLLRKSTVRIVILEEQLFGPIALLMRKYILLWKEQKIKKTILDDVLKVAQHYTTFHIRELSLQLYEGECLHCLPDAIPVNPHRVIRIVMNATTFVPHMSELPILGMLRRLSDLCVQTFARDERKHFVYLQCLAKMLDHPGHFHYVLESRTIEILLSLFQHHETPSLYTIQCLNLIISYFYKLSTDRKLTAHMLSCHLSDSYINHNCPSGSNVKEQLIFEEASKEQPCNFQTDCREVVKMVTDRISEDATPNDNSGNSIVDNRSIISTMRNAELSQIDQLRSIKDGEIQDSSAEDNVDVDMLVSEMIKAESCYVGEFPSSTEPVNKVILSSWPTEDKAGCSGNTNSSSSTDHTRGTKRPNSPPTPPLPAHKIRAVACQLCDRRIDSSNMENMNSLVRSMTAKLRWMVDDVTCVRMPAHEALHEVRGGGEEAEEEMRVRRVEEAREYYEEEEAANFYLLRPNLRVVKVQPPLPARPVSPSTSDISSDGPYSPSYRPNYIDDDSDSNDYSPICSDVEEENAITDDNLSAPETKEIDSFEKKYNPALREAIIGLCANINALLYSIMIRQLPKVGGIYDSELCVISLNASFKYTHNKFQTIKSVLSSESVLLDLMFTDFIPQLKYAISDRHAKCRICDTAEENCKTLISSFEKVSMGQDFKVSLRKRIHDCKKSADLLGNLFMTVTMFTENRPLMKLILKQTTGYSAFMDRLRTPKPSKMNLYCLNMFVHYFINITNPRILPDSPSYPTLCKPVHIRNEYETEESQQLKYQSAENDNKAEDTIVTFILDDGNTMKANRSLLSSQSSFFSGLLNGHFKESRQSEIRLKDVTLPALQLLVYLLRIDYPVLPKAVSRYELDLNIDLILETIQIADLYLKADIAVALATYVEQNIVDNSNVCRIYRWSLQSGTNFLRIECVAYILSKDLFGFDHYRLKTINKIIAAGFWEMLREDIENLVTRYTTITSCLQFYSFAKYPL